MYVCMYVCVQDSVICVPVPLYHCFGMVMGSLQVPVWGAKCVFPSAAFNPADALRVVQQQKLAVTIRDTRYDTCYFFVRSKADIGPKSHGTSN